MLGSLIEIKLPSDSDKIFGECFSEISRFENEYSRFIEASILSKMNSNLGKWHSATKEMIFLLEKAEGYMQRTEGNFDITLKDALDRLGYDSIYSFSEKPFVNKEHIVEPVVIDKSKMRVMLHKEIDFGGFGKGYALDCVSDILDRSGIQNFYINAGGDIYAKGVWEVLLEHPDDPKKAIGKISLDSCAIAGSSSNRRKWDGHHHLINARTMLPQNSVKAIFVIADNGIDADAYATGIFTAGFEEGIEISRNLQVKVFIISSNNKMYKSPGFQAEFFM